MTITTEEDPMANKRKMTSGLIDKPKFPTTYAVVGREHKKQVMAALDKMSESKSATIKACIHDPAHIKWEFVLDKAKDPPDSMTDAEEIVTYLKEKSKIYLKATAAPSGGGAGGRFIHFEQIDTVPATIMALFKERAKLIAGQREEVVEDGTDMDDEPQGFIAFQGSDESLLAQYDRWYSQHPTADKRLYFYVREGVKHLMESASDSSRRRM